MGHAGRQFQALFWKNWLCRLRHPVLSLAEFFWPCILFMILTVLRFQEPPRHRDNCFLQARDLPSRGILPFVQGLLCNTGSSCRNISFESSMDDHFRSSRFQTATDDSQVSSLAFLKEIQDLAEDIFETVDKAKSLQKLWLKRSETSGSSYGSSFLTVDLNKTEDVLSRLENLHQQPHVWHFLHSLPRLRTTHAHLEDSVDTVTHFLQAGLNLLTSLGALDWLPLQQTVPQVSRHVLNVTISTLRFLLQHGAAANESVYHLSLQNMVWDLQKVQSDLKSLFGLNDLQMERLLNYSAELKEIPTHSFLERMICSILSNTSEDEAESKGYQADCHPKWSAVKNYTIHAVSWLKLYGQLFDQWQQGSLLQNLLTGASHGLAALRDQFDEGSEARKVLEVSHTALLILSDSWAADGPRGSHLRPQIFEHLGKLQRTVSDLSPCPSLKRLPLLDPVLRNVVAQDLRFVQGVLSYLETSARDFIPGGPDSWRLEKDMFFWGLKQLLTKDASATCLNGHLSQEAALPTGNSSIWRSLWGVLCRSPSFNETSVLSQLLLAVKDAGRRLQDVIAGHTDGPISEPDRHLEDWKALGAQLSEVNLTCSQVFKPPGAAASPENGISPGGCEYQLISTVISHILEEGQMSLQEVLYWKVFSGIIGKTCELARYVNMHGSFQSSPLAFSENSPCQTQNMDWKAIIDNYFIFFNNVVTSPITSTARALNFTKHLLVEDKKLHTLENGPMNVLLSFVEFLEELLLSDPSGSFTAPEFHDLTLLPELVLNRSVLWRNHLESLQRDPHDGDAQKLLEFDKLVTEKIQSLKDHWMRRESKNILRFIKLILFEIKPELREFWLNGISQEERAKFEISSTLGNFSVPEYEKIFSKSFNFSQLIHSNWPQSPAVDADFIHLSRIILHGLSELSFLTQEQVSIALDTIFVLQNASELFSTLSEQQKQVLGNILTHINVFKDRDAALLLQTYSFFYQYFHKFLNIQKRESLIIYLTQIFRHILDLIKQFNIQNISKALLLLSETTEALGMIPEVSHCQQLLSVLNLLELQSQSLLSTEGRAPGVIHASLTGLKQLFVADEGFRVSLLQYVNQFFNDSAGTLLPSECFVLENAAISSVNYSGNEGASLLFPWTQLFSNLTINGSVISEFTAIHCTLSWIRTWTEIWGTLSQILKLDLNIFTSLHVGIIQLLDELENGGNISQNCQGIVPTYHTARLILNLFKNITQENGFHDWEGLLDLRDLWVALDNELAVVQSLNLAQAEGSFVTMETSLRQLKTFPMKTNASREFLSSLLDVFIELSKASDYVARNTDLINNFLSNDLTDPGGKFASGITELRETILFLRNVSQDRGLLSCADIFHSVTELISESNLLPVNASKKPAHILAMLSSIFSSKNASSSLDGCLAWIDVINRLCIMYNSSSLPGHLHSALGSFKDMENKVNSALKILTWVLNRKIPICPPNESNINCVNIYLKDVTEFLNIIVTPGLEKEKVAKFETLLVLFNNSTKLVNMIIANLTEDLEFASQFDWKHFRDLLLGPTGMSDGIPDQFQNIWQHSIALGKEMQKLFKGIIHSVLGSSSSSSAERVFSVFSVSPKERDISHLHNSVHHLANYIALNLTHYLQNSSEVVPHEIMKAVDLGIQLTRDVFNSLMPAVRFSIPENSDPAQVLKKVASLMHSLKKADTELIVGQLGEISENLMSFFKNLSRTGVDHLGVNMVVCLVDKLVASSHSWSVNHLLRLSRLLPQEVVTAVLDVYYALPHMAGLLQRVTDKNITESLRDIYNFTLLHGITMFNTTKEDFADAIKTLLDTVELVSDEPAVISEALMCLPRVWCSNHTTYRLEESLKVEDCNVQGHMSPSLYHMATSILDLLHLPRPSDSECINENRGEEITRKVVCAMHDFADWNSILSELLEIFHVKNVLGKTLQGLWHKVLPFMSPSGNQGNDSISELCPSGSIKQGALQIIKNLKHANFTKFKLLKNMLNKLGSLDKILNITQGTETSAQNNVSLNLGRIFKLISALWSLRNSTHHLLSPITNFLNADHTDRSPDSSGLKKNDEATHSFEDLWFHFRQSTMDPRNNLSLGQLLSDINRKIQGIALQNTTVQLPQLLEILDSSPLTMSEITEGFLFLLKHWLHEYENEDYFRLVQRLLSAMASGNSTDVTVLARDVTTYLGYLRNSTGEGDFDVGVLTRMLNQEQLADFSTVQSLLESIVMNLVSNFAERSQESALNFSGTDLHIRDFISLILNHTQSPNGGETAGQAEGFLKQLLETLFSSLLNGMPENKISLLLKDLHRDFMAEMSFVPRDKILEILKLDPFLTWLNEDTLMNIVSSFRTMYRLIKNSFSFNNRELSAVLKGSSHTHTRAPMVNADTEDHLDFFTIVTQFLSQVNNSVGLSKLNQNLRSVLHLVRESYVEMANIKDILFHSPALTCHSSSPMLQHTALAKLTELFSVVNSSFALRNRKTLESTLRLFGAISQVGAESRALEQALEISRTLAMLVNSTAELGGLASSVDSMVRLLNLAKKVSRKMATILGELSMSSTEDSWKILDTLYSIVLQSSQDHVKQIMTSEKVAPFIFEKTKALLMPFLDLSFAMIGVTRNMSQDPDVLSMSSSGVLSYVNQSKDFSEIGEEMAENLISTKLSLRDLEHLVVVIKNRTQNVSTDAANLWAESLDCLVPIINITNQMDFLKLYELHSTHHPQALRQERSQEVILSLYRVLTENSTERETFLKMVIDLTLQALSNGLKEDNWDIFNLLLTFAQHPNDLLKTIESVVEASSGIQSDSGDELSQDLFSNLSLIQNATRYQLAKEVLIGLSRIVPSREGLPPNNAQWAHFTRTLFYSDGNRFPKSATGQNVTSAKNGGTKEEMMAIPHGYESMSYFQKFLKALFAVIEHWQRVPQAHQSVFEMCQVFRQLEKPSEAVEMLHRVERMALRVLIIFAENPFLTKDILCAILSCRGMRSLILPVMQGVTLVHHHYQEMGKIWFSSDQLDCERLSKSLSSALEGFKSSLQDASSQGCTCRQPLVGTVQQHMHRLIKSLKETWMTKIPVLMFLSNFTVTEDVKVKDLMKNLSRLTEDLCSSFHISDETIQSILEATVSHSKLLSSVLAVALSGKCDEESLHLLLTFPNNEKSWFATRELCNLPGTQVFSLLVMMGQNLNLRHFIYKTLIPSEANGLLNSLLDVISSLSSILTRAQHALEQLPEFLHKFKITALLDMPDFQQVSQRHQAQSSSLASFQSVMRLLCKDQETFLSNSNMFVRLPRVNELLEDDKEKFNIPHDSTPFCLKLYQEILQSPNGALVWSFLKPILHGKILYTPNSPAINEVIQKANYTFYFVDKIKILSETLLKLSRLFQGSGNGQMFHQLQDALRNKFIRSFVESHLDIDVDKLTEDLQTYGQTLDQMFSHEGAGHFQFLGGILANLSSCVVLDRFQAVETVGALETTAHELMQQNSFLASVIFNSSLGHRHIRSARRKLPPHVIYTIRTNVLYSMRTDLIKYPSWKFHPQNLPADGFKYNYIFVPLQDIIERAIIAVQTGQEAVEPTTQAQAAPYPCHTSDLFLNNVGFFFPLIMMLTWMVSVASMVRKLVYEREIQIEEYMRMMGLHPAIHFLSWFLENMATLALSSAALAVILKMSGIFMHSDAFIIFLFLLDFGVSAVMLSYFLSVFFNQANTAALCTSLGYMISFLPYVVLLVLHNQLSFTIQSLLCLLSTTAFGQGVFFITFLEGQEEGIQWSHMYRAPEPGGMTFGWVCWMILFDSIVYFLCGWYFSNLVSGTFGLGKPWYFPFTASYWKSVCGLIEKRRCSLSSGLFFFNEDFGSKGSSQQNGPGELEGGTPGVALISVTKEYEGHKVAVQELTLTFHRDQITALLGTNGAGKTTIISMLMGLYPPTSGTIIINGKNLQTDLSKIREELGVCPQQDVLLDNLTVREHLMLFAAIKAPWWAKKERQQQVDKTLDEVELTQHQHKPARVLSGGMKRKLSIAIAFMGRSKTVVLDEPSSGVDPCSRRSLWDILLKYRKGRTIIFTTHHLDEAEMLSDHVAVLQQGKLRCYAPPAGLKETHGQGLTLTLTKQPSVLETQEPKDVARVTSLIQVYIPQAFLKDSSGGELTYTIPKDADKSCFKGLCQALDQNLQHLHLTGYGISDTTLEEVFLMLLQDTNKKSHITPETKLDPPNEIPVGPSPQHGASPVRTPPVWALSEPMVGFQLLLGQAMALLRKRLLHTLRAWKSTTSDLLLPVLFVALAMGLFMVQPLAITYPPLKLTPGHYGTAETYFFSSGNHGMDLTHVLLRKFGDKGPLCADGQLENSSGWHKDPFSGPEFQKSCGCLKCPNKSAGAPYLTNCLGHTLLNLSGYDVEEYLLVPSAKPRLGGWSFGKLNQCEEASDEMVKSFLSLVWYNQKGFHSLPSYLNHLNNLILWQYLPPDTSDWRQYGITLYSHPYGGALLNEDKILESIRQCGVALCIVLGFSILSASIGSSVVRDRVTGTKRLQHISGLGYRTYWLVNFLYDMLFYLVSVCLCVAIIAAFQLTAFTFRENLVATALLLALFGYAMIPWMYLISRIFPSSDVAFISYISLNFIFGLCTMLMTAMPRLLAIISKAQNLQNIYNVLKWVFTIFPQFCLGQGLIELCYNQIKYDLTHNFGIDSYVSPFEMNFLGWIFVELTLQGTVLLLLRILVHGDLLQWPRVHSAPQDTVKSAKDIDVEKEQMRVLEGKTEGDILVLCNLRKSYRSVFRRKTTAVHDLSLAIPRGECFGLLGVNGAGKSTTFKILTGEIPPSSGYAVVRTPQGDMVDLTSAGKVGILFGYCPQQDALDDLLTGWEHLQYYCSLRGIPKQYIPEVAADLVRRLHLESHVDKPVATYSGGTRRKLSTALALVGKPDILLLDEPSSGMDPCSKRYLWQTITQEVRDGCAAVLTSHSMEECEALCTRLAIMVDGSFRCLGPPQHIKNRFGDGYTVKIWLHKEGSQPSAVSDCLKVHFPGIQFKGQHLNLLEYHVQKSWECLADLFKVLENNKSLLNIKHYSISQTTLEQVFLNFATEQL
ncbi:ATP-binding cassette sub-family A member 13 isoform X2 [Microtus oregoni]|uniref:ATP-binding cassette sub-family A member 13 isoform X2 n=1 Tax=Microtus oregoni TaxID=111838 RepID=UPI001BB13E43|nr:ATP-binding cassette sub-family A member 13 isoform X2 [Microtus oregoni]